MRVNNPVLWRFVVILTILGLVLPALLLTPPGTVHASVPENLPLPPGPDRYANMTIDIQMVEWWLAAWRDNNIYCAFWVDHAGIPVANEVKSACDPLFYQDWVENNTACDEKNSRDCTGYYFIKVGSKPAKRDLTVKLPPPTVAVTLDGCEPDKNGWCTKQPSLVLTGQEPLPNEKITSVMGYAGTDPFTCKGKTCIFKLSDTKTSGIHLQFWAYSTYGDSSKVFDALIRVVNDGAKGNRLTPRWYVDVLSSQWVGTPIASCATAWEAFPPVGGTPLWLSTPDNSAGLHSNIPYTYLAANLIMQGVTDASGCPDGGLAPGGSSANACGLRAAAHDVKQWQNRFDALIFNVAKDGEVPAQLLKNLFSRESQFWPGVFRSGKDVGLGQMTEGGADTTLLWNPSFYAQFCPLVLNKGLCESNGFSQLKASSQALLRGALVESVDARCQNCPLGLDLSRADFSVSIFAHTLLANCEQAGKIVQNVTGDMPGQTVDYETMWRFTLVNYNAGSGCLADAVKQAYSPGAEPPLSWEKVSGVLDHTCPGAAAYVDDVSRDTTPVATPPPEPTPEAPQNDGP